MQKVTTEQTKNRRPDLAWFFQQPRREQLEILADHLQLAIIMFNQLMNEEVRQLAGERYSRDKPHEGRYRRWGTNPGSMRIGVQRVPVQVPRIYDTAEEAHRPLQTYTTQRTLQQPSQTLLQAVLLGLGTRNYPQIVETMAESFGLSKSQISATFKEQTAEAFAMFMERRFDHETFVALLLDGKSQQGAQIVIALGVTREGRKIPMGFVQATTENATSCADLLRDLLRRGLSCENGLLVVIDGAKGLRKAAEDVFGVQAVVMRCQFHKRKNIVSYLPEADQPRWNTRLRAAMAIPDLAEARAALLRCRDELHTINVSAANSLEEGLDEYLTLQRLGISEAFHVTFSTTNSIENLNSQIGRYTQNVKRWTTSDQRHRWIAASLLDAEERMRRIPSAGKIPVLQAALVAEVKRRLHEQTIQSSLTNATSRISTRKRA
jgi:putative transposase